MVDVCVPLAAKRVLIMPNGLFTSTNFEDAKGLIDEPLNLSDVAKGHSVDTSTHLSILMKDTIKGTSYILRGKSR